MPRLSGSTGHNRARPVPGHLPYTGAMTTAGAAFWAGVRAELPILVGVAPFGLIFGVVAMEAGLSPPVAAGMSTIIFAGSAQFLAVQLFSQGAAALLVIGAVAIVNLRHALYSASLAPRLAHLSRRWRWLLAYLLTDEAYAVIVTEYARGRADRTAHWFALGAGLSLWSCWQGCTLAGIVLGSRTPVDARWGLDFTIAVTFIALLVPALRDRAMIVAALAAGSVALAGAALPYKLGLLLGAGAGIGAGLLLESRAGRTSPAPVTSP